MALSMDEQRILAEIERRLAADDPGLASCLSTFRRPGPGSMLRSPRARIIGSLFTVILVALVSLMIYAMIPFRAHIPRNATTPSASVNTTLSATGTQVPASQHATGGASTTDASGIAATVSNGPAGHSSGTAAAKSPWAKADGTSAPASSAIP